MMSSVAGPAAAAGSNRAAAAAAAAPSSPVSHAAPIPLPVTVDTTGAKILDGSNAERDSRDIYLPNHVETVSHIAIDVGGSLAKVVYFTRLAQPTASVSTGSSGAQQAATATTTKGSSANSSAEALSHAGPSSHGSHMRSSSHAFGTESPAASGSRLHSRESSAAGHALGDSTASLASTSSAGGQAHGRPLRSADGTAAVPAGTLTPTSLFTSHAAVSASAIHSHFMRRRSLPSQLPGGRLNFVKFETGDIQSCVDFLVELITLSAKANNVSLAQMRKGVKLMATGGGAHLFYDMFERELGVEVRREDEMGCLITGLNFITLIPDETFYYSDELVDNINATRPGPKTARIDDSQDSESRRSGSPGSSSSGSSSSHARASQQPLPRPSPDPPLYSPIFDSNPLPKLPCLLVNIGSGVSIIKVDEDGKYERVSGTSLGGGTLWGLLSLITDADSFDEMLEMASRGDNGTVDMLVSDVYGASDALSNLGLKSTTIASSFGKVFRKDKSSQGESGAQAREQRRKKFRQEDICKSLLYAISNNIGQIAYMNAEKFGLDRIYFGGCFIRGHQATIATLSYAIRFWSKGQKRAFFLRHEGYLGALGAWIRQFYDSNGAPATPTTPRSPNPLAAADSAQRSHLAGAARPTPSSSLAASATRNAAAQGDTRIPKDDYLSNTQARGTIFQSEDTPRQRTPMVTPGGQTQNTSSQFANGLTTSSNLNPILAEALGGAPLESSVNGTSQSNHVNGITATDAQDLEVATNGETEESANNIDIAALAESLSPQDRALLAPLLDGGDGQGLDELIGAAANGNDLDDASIAELLQKMDAMHGAADGLEDRLDTLLARLDGMLETEPQEQ